MKFIEKNIQCLYLNYICSNYFTKFYQLRRHYRFTPKQFLQDNLIDDYYNICSLYINFNDFCGTRINHLFLNIKSL